MVDNGKIRTYDHWFVTPVRPPRKDFFPSPSYLYKEHKLARCSEDRYCWLSH